MDHLDARPTEIVEQFFARMNAHDTTGVLELLDDTALWWIARRWRLRS